MPCPRRRRHRFEDDHTPNRSDLDSPFFNIDPPVVAGRSFYDAGGETEGTGKIVYCDLCVF